MLIYIMMKQQMTKTEEVKIETIDNQIKVWEKIETIYPETIQTPDYSYWTNQNTIDWQIAIRNLSTWWWKYFTWFIQLSTAWTFTIAWVWFIPKMIKFDVIWTGMSWGSWYNWNNRCIAYYSWATLDYSNSRCFRLTSSDWLWYIESVNSDWFVLNYNWWTTANIQYQCYW